MQPQLIRSYATSLYRIWMLTAKTIGTITGSMIFGIVYVVVIGTYALFRTDTHEPTTRDTFWRTKTSTPATKKSLLRPF